MESALYSFWSLVSHHILVSSQHVMVTSFTVERTCHRFGTCSLPVEQPGPHKPTAVVVGHVDTQDLVSPRDEAEAEVSDHERRDQRRQDRVGQADREHQQVICVLGTRKKQRDQHQQMICVLDTGQTKFQTKIMMMMVMVIMTMMVMVMMIMMVMIMIMVMMMVIRMVMEMMIVIVMVMMVIVIIMVMVVIMMMNMMGREGVGWGLGQVTKTLPPYV